MKTLIGPFTQILTMRNLPLKGSLDDNQMEIIYNGGIVVEDNYIYKADKYDNLKKQENYKIEFIKGNNIAIPGFIDAHTHICFAGERSKDFIDRMNGLSYLEIANRGGGINTTVKATRNAAFHILEELTKYRANRLLQNGITTAEVKSGYGLNVPDEIKILQVINKLNDKLPIDLIPTCLAAHTKPFDFNCENIDYLKLIVNELLPFVKKESLSNRVDIFVEKTAFSVDEARFFLQEAKDMGFKLIVHGDQFTVGGSKIAVELGAVSVDHLEVSTENEITNIAVSNTTAVILPGASLGMGLGFAPARKLLNNGASLVIASDWNPGSAPMGDLLLQACLLGTYEKLTPAEILAGITCRAAHVLDFKDRGSIEKNKKADFISFKCKNFNEIIYHQGSLKPSQIWKNGKSILKNNYETIN